MIELNPVLVLIVDDKPENVKVLAEYLRLSGTETAMALNGETGLTRAAALQPALILLDIMLPDIDGFEVCRHLKADKRTRDIPIVFISALRELPDKVKAFAAGGVDYITKPFEQEEVLARVNTHLNIRRLQQQLQEENARLKTLESASFEGIVIHDQGCILDLNDRLLEMFGYLREEMLGHHVTHFVTPASQKLAEEYLDSSEELFHELEGVKKDGTVFPLQVHGKALRYHGRNVRVVTLRDLSLQRRLEEENRTFKTAMQDSSKLGLLVGKSTVMQQLYELVTNAAATDYGVIISGESGSGKELAARTIHQLSRRRERKFVPVNCGAVTESLFEREFFGHRKGAFTGAHRNQPGFFDLANRGTLFLDEVAELSPSMQTKLLRVLENKEYIPIGDTSPKQADVRILAATNHDLEELRRQGQLRDDFFYRLHVIHIHLPPLRDRREDIPMLVEHLLGQEGLERARAFLPAETLARLAQYDWPGNVRQLRNVLQVYLTTGRVQIPGAPQVEDVRELAPEPESLQQAVEAYEKQCILDALRHNQDNRSLTAAKLGITRSAFYNKLKKYGIE